MLHLPLVITVTLVNSQHGVSKHSIIITVTLVNSQHGLSNHSIIITVTLVNSQHGLSNHSIIITVTLVNSQHGLSKHSIIITVNTEAKPIACGANETSHRSKVGNRDQTENWWDMKKKSHWIETAEPLIP